MKKEQYNRREFIALLATSAFTSRELISRHSHTQQEVDTPTPTPEIEGLLQFQEEMSDEGPSQAEFIPAPTTLVIDHLGLSVAGGGHDPARTLFDLDQFAAPSLLYMGTDISFLQSMSHHIGGVSDAPLIITRSLNDNVCKENTQEYFGFLHTLDCAKNYVGSTISQRPIMEIFNEPNLYNRPENPDHYLALSPSESAAHFMRMARIVIENGAIPLLPPLASHTGTEYEWYTEFLQAVRSHSDFRTIQPHLEVSMHAYVTYSGENPFDRIEDLCSMVEEILHDGGTDSAFPIHLTEFGLQQFFADSLTPFERAIELKRLLHREVPTHLPIRSLQYWILEAETPPPGKTENYRNQALRWVEDGAYFNTVLYGALSILKKKRAQDLIRRELYQHTHGINTPGVYTQ